MNDNAALFTMLGNLAVRIDQIAASIERLEAAAQPRARRANRESPDARTQRHIFKKLNESDQPLTAGALASQLANELRSNIPAALRQLVCEGALVVIPPLGKSKSLRFQRQERHDEWNEQVISRSPETEIMKAAFGILEAVQAGATSVDRIASLVKEDEKKKGLSPTSGDLLGAVLDKCFEEWHLLDVTDPPPESGQFGFMYSLTEEGESRLVEFQAGQRGMSVEQFLHGRGTAGV